MVDTSDPRIWALVYTASEWIIRIGMLAYVPTKRTPDAAKAWLLFTFFLPWPGLILYTIIGRAAVPDWRREQLARLPQALAPIIDRLRRHPNILHPQLKPELDAANRLARKLGHLPSFGGNHTEILVDYQGVIDRIVADIDSAMHHVHILFYIYADDSETQPVTDAIARAAKRGVACRVLIDALGSRRWLSSILPKLKTAGADVHLTLPIKLFAAKASLRRDMRNHRKIVVIDGRIAYAGSQNLVSREFKPGLVFEELMIRLTGPGVLALQYVFISDWYLESDQILDQPDVFPAPEIRGQTPVQVLPSGPTYSTETTQRLVTALIHGAQRRIVITTPYFIPDTALCQALQTAVLRDVEVHLVVSAERDQLLVGFAQESYYEEMLENGVQIHRYGKRFLHAKHLSIDDDVALIGSSNMDIRSFALNAEISVLAYDEHVVARMKQEQERYFRDAERLTLQQWRSRSRLRKFSANLARLFSPLL